MAKTTAAKKANRKYAEAVADGGAELDARGKVSTDGGETETYRVLRPVTHDGVLYLAGDAIDLDREDAAPLLVKKHIDQPELVQLVVRQEPMSIPTPPPMPGRILPNPASVPSTTAAEVAAAVAAAS